MLNFLHKLARSTSGTAFIEATIVLPLAISLMAGGVEFGRILSDYGTVGKSVRAAARYLSRLPADPSDASAVTNVVCSNWALQNARNLAVYGKLSPSQSDQPLITGWIPNTVDVTQCTSGFDDPPVVTVAAAVPYTVSMLSAIGLPNTYTLSSQHEQRFIGSAIPAPTP
jgi:Flp pilus assembly protein TadG